ncbi:MAG: ATP-binding protein [Gemmatimonadota bacterium]|nr:ATP-binding protein [Gemmatimonadota bacterium]
MSGPAGAVLVSSPRPAVAADLAGALRGLGADPLVATGPDQWPVQPPVLAFVDLAGGEMHIRQARSRFGPATEIVALVDGESLGSLLPALAAGAVDYLFHPLNRAELGLRWKRVEAGHAVARSGGEGLSGRLRFEVPSRVEHVRVVVDELVAACERFAFRGARATLNLRVAAGEALANAILYGSREDPGRTVVVSAELQRGSAVVTVEDAGAGFDPRQVADPTSPENRSRSRGRGLFLLRSLADEVRWNEKGNAVTLVVRG